MNRFLYDWRVIHHSTAKLWPPPTHQDILDGLLAYAIVKQCVIQLASVASVIQDEALREAVIESAINDNSVGHLLSAVLTDCA